jgi:hypothetical protein
MAGEDGCASAARLPQQLGVLGPVQPPGIRRLHGGPGRGGTVQAADWPLPGRAPRTIIQRLSGHIPEQGVTPLIHFMTCIIQ